MNFRTQDHCLILFIVFLTGLSFISCATSGGGVIVNGNNAPSSGNPPVVKKGPPDHAPAHGYRAKHKYLYYPSCSVYYDHERKIYFYLKGDQWEVNVTLPNRLRIRLGDSVTIEMHTDKPYVHHAQHVKKYPPGHMKKKHKKKHKRG